MITVRNLSKRFGKLQVLNGLSIEIAAERVTAIVGPNGAGKTTLVKSVLGLTQPESGAIELSGQPITTDGRYRSSIGYMPQMARFPENLSPKERRGPIKPN